MNAQRWLDAVREFDEVIAAKAGKRVDARSTGRRIR
jgi:hypothetical protein